MFLWFLCLQDVEFRFRIIKSVREIKSVKKLVENKINFTVKFTDFFTDNLAF
jgi:hypothetical protein